MISSMLFKGVITIFKNVTFPKRQMRVRKYQNSPNEALKS